MDFFDQMDVLERTFWFIALPSSLFFIIQTIMTFLGSDASDGNVPDFDGDFDIGHAPFQLFSLRNLTHFLLGFSWTGISFYHYISSSVVLILLSLIVGLSFIALFFFLLKAIMKLGEDNTFQINQCLQKTATVYIKIPEKKSGVGKIQVSVNHTIQELSAITNGDGAESGSLVRIIEILDNQLVLVEKI
ncbi:MAG: serine protease [Flavobacteriia bacterium]|nr:serine protease [Flavobacteriia bacterium]